MADNNLNINFGQKGIADLLDYGLFATITLHNDKMDLYRKWLQVAKITDRLYPRRQGARWKSVRRTMIHGRND